MKNINTKCWFVVTKSNYPLHLYIGKEYKCIEKTWNGYILVDRQGQVIGSYSLEDFDFEYKTNVKIE